MASSTKIMLKNFNQGKDAFRKGNLTLAKRYFNTCISLNYEYQTAYFYLGVIAYYEFNLTDSFRYLQMVMSLNSQFGDVFYFLGKILILLENFQDALDYFKKAIETAKTPSLRMLAYEEVKSYLTEEEKFSYKKKAKGDYLIKVQVDIEEELLEKGLTYRLDKKYDKSIECFNKLLVEFPHYFQGWLQLAETYSKDGQFLNSQNVYLSIKKKFPISKLVDYHLSEVYFHLKKYTKAIYCARSVLKTLPHHYKLLFNIGMMLNLLKKDSQAIYFYEKSLKLKDNFFPSIYNLAVTYQKIGHLDNSLVYYKKGQALAIDNTYIYYNMGIIYFEQKDYVNSLFHLTKAYQIDPTFTEAHDNFQYISFLRSIDTQMMTSIGYSPVIKILIAALFFVVMLTLLYFLGVI